jgi:hypothetical protein
MRPIQSNDMNNQRTASYAQSTGAGRKLRSIVLPLVTVLLAGCSTPHQPAASAAYYYLNPNKTLTTVGRVAIVELRNDSSYPQASADITTALFQALQKEQFFGLKIVQRDDPSWRSLQLEGDSTYNLNQLLAIRETLKCDGLLVGTITTFRPFPHMAVGLRLKLLDLRDGQLLWALEQVWDSADNTTEKRIEDYFKSEKRSGLEPLNEQLASISPLEFIRFVSFEVAQTL